jgi:hypothetical protein
MQLLFKRSLQTGVRLKFVLWAKFDINEDETRLINKYKAADAYITIEQSRRDLYRAIIFSFFIATLLASLIMGVTNMGMLGGGLYFGSVVHGYSTRLIKYLWCCHGRCGSKNPRF